LFRPCNPPHDLEVPCEEHLWRKMSWDKYLYCYITIFRGTLITCYQFVVMSCFIYIYLFVISLCYHLRYQLMLYIFCCIPWHFKKEYYFFIMTLLPTSVYSGDFHSTITYLNNAHPCKIQSFIFWYWNWDWAWQMKKAYTNTV
jgi:hypothetical protein